MKEERVVKLTQKRTAIIMIEIILSISWKPKVWEMQIIEFLKILQSNCETKMEILQLRKGKKLMLFIDQFEHFLNDFKTLNIYFQKQWVQSKEQNKIFEEMSFRTCIIETPKEVRTKRTNLTKNRKKKSMQRVQITSDLEVINSTLCSISCLESKDLLMVSLIHLIIRLINLIMLLNSRIKISGNQTFKKSNKFLNSLIMHQKCLKKFENLMVFQIKHM